MSPTTVVRFRDVREQQDYRATHPRLGRSDWHHREDLAQAVVGQSVRIELPPIAPATFWPCAPELIWRLARGEAERITGIVPPSPIYVCEHQVEID